MHFHGLDVTFGVDDEGAAQCQAFFVNMHVKCAGQGVGWVTDQGEFGFADRRRSLVPHLVGEMRVGGDDVHVSASFLEFSVVVGCVFDFGGAVEGECRRHKNEHIPLALDGLVGDGNELAVMERFVFESLDCGVDQRHGDFL